MIIIIGSIGSDAGYTVIDDTGIHHVGGWQPEAMLELQSAVAVMRDASRLKTPGVGNAVAKSVYQFATEQIRQNVTASQKGASEPIIIIGG